MISSVQGFTEPRVIETFLFMTSVLYLYSLVSIINLSMDNKNDRVGSIYLVQDCVLYVLLCC